MSSSFSRAFILTSVFIPPPLYLWLYEPVAMSLFWSEIDRSTKIRFTLRIVALATVKSCLNLYTFALLFQEPRTRFYSTERWLLYHSCVWKHIIVSNPILHLFICYKINTSLCNGLVQTSTIGYYPKQQLCISTKHICFHETLTAINCFELESVYES